MATLSTQVSATGSGLHQSVHGTRFPIAYVENTIDLDLAEADKASALAANDVIEAIYVPAGSVVLAAGLEVTVANSGSSALTFDLGIDDTDQFVDGFDFEAASVGDYSVAPASGGVAVVGNTAETLDLKIATLTTTNTGGAVRVWALIGDITDQVKPGLVALGS